eukprot:CAMPEP_0168314840 /NCGR_PEP_ID=MMETSP0210-20121227/9570_1 /TAXON_ID=40633 /ORGANISM="Condylostoma magnum, Strain COL2" /LENGTH=60 /DNA_ID=CAMNT_0008285253 /DNA_START=1441 /DNA_END=1623 /DNA_ORIENTATION=-
MTVGQFRSLCAKVFKTPIAEFKMLYRESKETIMPEELDDDLKELNYYIIQDTGEIWLEDN